MNIYLSYAPTDAPLADKIKVYLRTKQHHIWDASEAPVNPNTNLLMTQALAAADCVIALLTRAGRAALQVTGDVRAVQYWSRFRPQVYIPVAVKIGQRNAAELPAYLSNEYATTISTELSPADKAALTRQLNQAKQDLAKFTPITESAYTPTRQMSDAEVDAVFEPLLTKLEKQMEAGDHVREPESQASASRSARPRQSSSRTKAAKGKSHQGSSHSSGDHGHELKRSARSARSNDE